MPTNPETTVSVVEQAIPVAQSEPAKDAETLLSEAKADLVVQATALKSEGLYLFKLENGKALPKANTLSIPDSGDTALRIVLASGDMNTAYSKLVAGDSRGPKWQLWVESRFGKEWRAKYASSSTVDSFVMVLVSQSKAMPDNKVKLVYARTFLKRLDAIMSFFEVAKSMTVEEFAGVVPPPTVDDPSAKADCEL